MAKSDKQKNNYTPEELLRESLINDLIKKAPFVRTYKDRIKVVTKNGKPLLDFTRLPNSVALKLNAVLQSLGRK